MAYLVRARARVRVRGRGRGRGRGRVRGRLLPLTPYLGGRDEDEVPN